MHTSLNFVPASHMFVYTSKNWAQENGARHHGWRKKSYWWINMYTNISHNETGHKKKQPEGGAYIYTKVVKRVQTETCTYHAYKINCLFSCTKVLQKTINSKKMWIDAHYSVSYPKLIHKNNATYLDSNSDSKFQDFTVNFLGKIKQKTARIN